MAKLIEWGEYAPDLSSLGSGATDVTSGCVPHEDGLGPFKSLQELTASLPLPCRGHLFARLSDGSIASFAGTASRLYLLDNSTLTWIDVSKGGGAYADMVTADNWQFAQFNDFVIAVNQNNPPQKFILSSATKFVDLGGSPPNARFVTIIGLIVVLTGLLSNPRRMQWSDLDAPEQWTAGIGISDFQDMPDGGSCLGISGGDSYGLLFQEASIRSVIYAPGSATTFQIIRISTQDTLFAAYSIINAGTRTFFLSAQGFKVVEAGGQPKPIGKERVDRTFFEDVDPSNLQLVIGATDPTATRVYWAYKSTQTQTILFDKILCYDWSIGENGRWSLLPISGEYLTSLARPGLTLEQLDASAPTPLNILGVANNGSGLIRLTLNALFNADFTVVGQNFIVVYGVVGTGGLSAAVNTTWAFTVIDSTHIDLVGSTFVGAYTSGGHIGGSLDLLPFSLDSVPRASVAALAAFSSAHKLGFFTGPNLEAIIETGEQDLEGRLVFVQGVRPLTDSAEAAVSIGCRLNANAASTFTAESIVDANGFCGLTVETRYAKARLRVPAASVWTYARGVEPDAVPAGEI